MKIKQILSAALVVATLFNFSSCKEDDGIDWDYSIINDTKKLTGLDDLQGKVITTSSVKITAGQINSTLSKSNQHIEFDVDYGVKDETMTHCDGVTSIELNLDKPFEEYIIKFVVYGKDDEGNMSQPSDTVTVDFYYIPEFEISLSRVFGNNEDATTIKWEYNTKQGDNIIAFDIPNAKRKQASISVDISSDEIQSNIKSIELTGESDSVYIKGKDVNGNVAYNVFDTINGQEELRYIAAYKYKFDVTVKIPVGDKIVEKTSSIKSILVKNDLYAIDDELNIYRTIAIGDDIWTADDLRLRNLTDVEQYYIGIKIRDDKYFYYRPKYSSCRYFDHLNDHIINGYHLSTDADWERLEKHFGIEYGEEGYSYGFCSDDLDAAFDEEDESKYAQYSKYFASNTPWEFFSDEKHESSFYAKYYGYTNGVNMYRVGEFAAFIVDGKYNRGISKKYKSMFRVSNGCEGGSIRLVKDRK